MMHGRPPDEALSQVLALLPATADDRLRSACCPRVSRPCGVDNLAIAASRADPLDRPARANFADAAAPAIECDRR